MPYDPFDPFKKPDPFDPLDPLKKPDLFEPFKPKPYLPKPDIEIAQPLISTPDETVFKGYGQSHFSFVPDNPLNPNNEPGFHVTTQIPGLGEDEGFRQEDFRGGYSVHDPVEDSWFNQPPDPDPFGGDDPFDPLDSFGPPDPFDPPDFG